MFSLKLVLFLEKLDQEITVAPEDNILLLFDHFVWMPFCNGWSLAKVLFFLSLCPCTKDGKILEPDWSSFNHMLFSWRESIVCPAESPIKASYCDRKVRAPKGNREALAKQGDGFCVATTINVSSFMKIFIGFFLLLKSYWLRYNELTGKWLLILSIELESISNDTILRWLLLYPIIKRTYTNGPCYTHLASILNV